MDGCGWGRGYIIFDSSIFERETLSSVVCKVVCLSVCALETGKEDDDDE